nr:PhnD/SsuA/transferrin family substrate-binding protein [Vibrio gigantis]
MPSYAQQKIVRIGVLAFNGAAYTLKRWQPTVDYLNYALPDYHFIIVPADIPTLDHLVDNELVDFTLTNGIQFLFYKYNHQAVKMLNLNPFHGEARHAIGSALIARIDEPEVTSLKELKKRSIVSVSEKAFGGFRVMLGEMLKEGVTQHDLQHLNFVGYPQQKLLTKVLNGEADFAIAPTCLLERHLRDGTIPRNTLKITFLQKPKSPFACHTSSELYPNWTLARMKHVPADYSNHIARILLTIPANSDIAITGLYGGWSVPIDDSSIYQLMEDIGVSIQPSYIEKLWLKYRVWALSLVVLLLMFVVYHLRVNYLVYIRSAQLRDEIEQHKKTSLLLENETTQLFKAQRILLTGEMASGIAHELNQPLMAIGTYTAGCKSRLKKGSLEPKQLESALDKIEQQTVNASNIIQRMRHFMKVQHDERQVVDLVQLISNTLLIFQHTFEHHNIRVDLNSSPASASLDFILIQQVLANLIQNSIDALKEVDVGSRRISISACEIEDMCLIEIEDNGCGISDKQLEQLFMPFQSSKESGLGLGMVICKRIIEAHEGTITALQLEHGCRLSITLPKVLSEE